MGEPTVKVAFIVLPVRYGIDELAKEGGVVGHADFADATLDLQHVVVGDEEEAVELGAGDDPPPPDRAEILARLRAAVAHPPLRVEHLDVAARRA